MLGHKDEYSERLPRVVGALLGRDIVMVACGVAHTMALSGEHTHIVCIVASCKDILRQFLVPLLTT